MIIKITKYKRSIDWFCWKLDIANICSKSNEHPFIIVHYNWNDCMCSIWNYRKYFIPSNIYIP